MRRSAWSMVLVLLSLSASAEVRAGSGSVEPAPAEIAGTAIVIDGDTIEILKQRIRLEGFDSPEEGSVCGDVDVYETGARVLADFIGARPVICQITGQDRRGRKIGQCEVGGEGLAEFMVLQGWGRDWPRYSKGAFAGEEALAREANAGIWGLDCPPDLWGNRNYTRRR